MKKIISTIAALVLICSVVAGCANKANEPLNTSTPKEPSTQNTVDTKKPENSINKEKVYKLVSDALLKTASENNFLMTEKGETYIEKNTTTEINGISESVDVETKMTTSSEVTFLNRNTDYSEVYHVGEDIAEYTITSAASKQVVEEGIETTKVLSYTKDGFTYGIMTSNDGRTLEAKDTSDNFKTWIFALLEQYDKDYLSKIDFSDAIVKEDGQKTVISNKFDEETYNLFKFGEDDSGGSNYHNMTIEFTIENDYLTKIVINATREGCPWTLVYTFSNFGEDMVITPPEGYEDFEMN